MELDQPFGTISDIKVTRKKKNLVIATLKATYSEQSYTVYAYITQSKGVWKAIQYDTNGNRSIKVSDSTGGILMITQEVTLVEIVEALQ